METSSISRVNYYSGEALLTADFQDEQKYHIEMRERLSRGLLSRGIVDGLDVEWQYQTQQVTVRAGEALDGKGRLIVLTQDALVPLPGLVDGTQNFLTISYAGHASEVVTTVYGEGYKRWVEEPSITCTQDYDPSGDDVLLAVISAQGGEIQHLYYFYGAYKRQRVSAALQSVQFIDGADQSSEPPPMFIGAVGNGQITVQAPKIVLDGVVTAGTSESQFEGKFTGSFTGDGSGLTNVPFPNHAGYWKRNDGDGSLFYTEGNVGVNVTEPTAVFTVGQSVLQEVGVGLVTAISSEKGIVTLQGYQTNFTSDLVGKILQFGVVLKQEAMIASVDTDESLTLSKSFPLGLGPTSYGYKSSESEEVTIGAGKITPDGVTVHGHGTQFSTQLKAGDTLVIDRFVPDSKVHESKIDTSKTITDTSLTLTEAFSEDVTDSGYLYSTVAGRWISGEGTITSAGTTVTGTGTAFATLPKGATLRAIRALEVVTVPQTWRVDAVADATHLTMHKISIDEGSPVVPMMSAFAITTWPLMKVGGGERPDVAPALTVVQNNGSVPNTVAINVDDKNVKIDSNYALQVNGPVSLSSLDVDKDLTVEGSLTVDGDLDVKGSGTFDKNLTVGERAQVRTLEVTSTDESPALKVDGSASIATLDVTSTTAPAATITTLKVTGTDGPGLTVTGAAQINTLEVTSTSASPALKVDANAQISTLEVTSTATDSPALTVAAGAKIKTLEVTDTADPNGLVVDGGAHVIGTLTVDGGIVGTLKDPPSIGMGALGQISGSPYKIGNHSPNSGNLISSGYTAPSDGFFTLHTDNDDSNSDGSNFNFVFDVCVSGGSAYTAHFRSQATGNQGPTVSAVAFIGVPVKKGDVVTASYWGGGANNLAEAINVYMWFREMKVG